MDRRQKIMCAGLLGSAVVVIITFYLGGCAGQKPIEQEQSSQQTVVLVESQAGPNEAELQREITVRIDAEETGEAISPYVYGQFIEHLGRCIYGGIWAEMLEDRKFYYAVGSEGSAWKVVGDSNNIDMVRDNPYAGEHTPRVEVSGQSACGIAQGGLGLVKGNRYEGRVILLVEGTVKVDVSLVWGQGESGRETVSIDAPKGEYVKIPIRFVAGGESNEGRLEIVGQGEGTFRIGTASLMPGDNVEGMRADVLAILKELGAPMYRWPGGNFVSGYDWRDGIGERDRRPPRINLAWSGLESDDFGIDEFMTFCRLVGAEPAVTVNTGFGDSYSAAQEVKYANSSPETAAGRLRAANGHREPYKVKWWFVGNEMWGNWQLGYMQLKQYVIKHNLFAEAMHKADPSIKLIGVGDIGEWSIGMLTKCADNMDLISEHFYCDQKKDLAEHVRQIRENVEKKVAAHRDYRSRLKTLQGRDIDIALDEWNYWYGKQIFGQLGNRYFLRDALGIAEGLHEMYRNSDIVAMANYAQTVNVLGAIKTTKTEAAFETTGLVLKMYREHYGQVPVKVQWDANAIDVAAAWTKDKGALTIGVVNPAQRECELILDLKGAKIQGDGRIWRIAGEDPMAYNEPGKEPKVVIEEKAVSGVSNKLTVPGYSASIFELVVE